MKSILQEIINERTRQDKKWGTQNHHPLKWVGIIGEEYGEVCKAVLENEFPEGYRKELVQVAASAVAAIESLDRAMKDEVRQ